VPESRALELTASIIKLLFAPEGDFLQSGSASENVVITRNTDESFAGAQVRRLQAGEARFGFFPEANQPRYLDAEENVRVIYERKTDASPGSAVESFRSASHKFRAVFELENGASVLKSVRQWGNFTYQDALRKVSGERCDYNAAGQQLVLTGSPRILDEMSDTTGQRVEYDQNKGEISVFGQVRSTLGASKGRESFFGSSSSSSPVIITAEEMHGAQDETIRYSRNVQLLSESQHLQAQMLDIFGGGDRVEAEGGILHIISGSAGSNGKREADKSAESAKREPMSIRSEKLKYLRADKTLAYSGDVRLESGDLLMFSNSLDAELDVGEKNVESAIARGGANGREEVFIRQGGRECTGDLAHWYLDPGKFEVIGSPAEAYDPERGRSSARRLTYFTADDRIRLESR
jgi:lipopolysaccharide export system protein LptA